MKKIPRIFILFIVSFLLISCSDDDDSQAIILYVSKMTVGNRSVTFEYNNKNQLVKYSIPYYDQTSTFEYDGDNITKIKVRDIDYNDITYSFVYGKDSIFVTTNQGGRKDTIIFNSKKQVVKVGNYVLTYDSRGNVIQEDLYGEGKVVYRDVMTYDNNNGISKNLNVPVWVGYYSSFGRLWFAKVNNETSRKTYYYGNIEGTLHFTYNYSSFGYPISGTQVNNKGTVSEKISDMTIEHIER